VGGLVQPLLLRAEDVSIEVAGGGIVRRGNSATDIDPDFGPLLVSLGEPTDFSRDVEYALTLRRRLCWFTDKTKHMIDETFRAKDPRNVGIIEYAFTAFADNKASTRKIVHPYVCRKVGADAAAKD
jgi:hypothetical protein